ncbi:MULTISPECIES: hypothetical protein [unclassified Rhodococcus (in: high G+C Gram-positive bacteria)]|uniref:hypothetical protein n=1 Tax=unclassified Rhodococcus (in: high G+C Gram-positive bacteria) TaxID=192944 RepID=UPI001AE26ED0|nr:MULTISPECIES: hypothetical protein [unclassified Rhodococcus (in: high G+C Gram-positive bacteria)]MBP2524249.1 hypothetical protein [Rhodococcus sp. PvP104]MDA3637467.1 hypothetical protein [Rhodococcus sp. C-2]
MSKADIVWNPHALEQLRRGAEVMGHLHRTMEKVHAAVGGDAAGYTLSSVQGQKRPQGRGFVSVAATTAQAKRSEAKHNNLIRAAGASSG